MKHTEFRSGISWEISVDELRTPSKRPSGMIDDEESDVYFCSDDDEESDVCCSSDDDMEEEDDQTSSDVCFCSDDDMEEESMVCFVDEPKVHILRAWSFAYRQARRGEWEQHGRDRVRFANRVHSMQDELSRVLSTEHRKNIIKRNEKKEFKCIAI